MQLICNMSMKYRKYLRLIILAPILMAFQCEDDSIDIIRFNSYKANVTAKKVFSINDTIWIKGSVSAMAFNETQGDSIFNENTYADVVSIFKFITPEEHHNTEEAVNAFKIHLEKGMYSEFGPCEKSGIVLNAALENNNQFYSYKIGLIPTSTGDFVIDFVDSDLQNAERNLAIAEDYPITRHPNTIGFSRCESLSWLYLEDSTTEFLFSVE